MTEERTIVTEDPWKDLHRFTAARIALGRCGVSPPLKEILDFRLSHARARDAVHQHLDTDFLLREMSGSDCLLLASAVEDRQEYLTRPDKGRRLRAESRAALAAAKVQGVDLCLVVADGLSPKAIHENAPAFVRGFLSLATRAGLSAGPVCVVENGRVAIADEIGMLMDARLALICIGERPGLMTPNSMGIYITCAPRIGTTDAFRNCISNVHPGGLSIPQAVVKAAYLVENGLHLGRTGVELKDRMGRDYLPFGKPYAGLLQD